MKSGSRQEAHKHDQGAKKACEYEDRAQLRRSNVFLKGLLNCGDVLLKDINTAIQAILRCFNAGVQAILGGRNVLLNSRDVFLQEGDIILGGQPVSHQIGIGLCQNLGLRGLHPGLGQVGDELVRVECKNTVCHEGNITPVAPDSNAQSATRSPAMRYSIIFLPLLLILFTALPAEARQQAEWCERRTDLGWHFYCDPPEEPEPEIPAPAPELPPLATPPKPIKPPQVTVTPDQSSSVARIEAMRAELEEARATAILDPSQENVVHYMYLQQEMVTKAALFADTWKRALWQSPDLDYTARHPQNQLGKQIVKIEKARIRQEMLAGLNDDYALIYVGSANCPVCQLYGPLLRRFAGEHQISVLAVSADGSTLAGWPEAVPDQGQLERMGLAGSPVPLTALFARAGRNVTILGAGLLAQDELARRIHSLTEQEPGDAF